MIHIRAATGSDASEIAAIYAPYVSASAVSFEDKPPSAETMAKRIAAANGRYPWLVAVSEADGVLAFAYATAFRERVAYRFTVETTIYVTKASQGKGVGTLLYSALLDTLEAQGFTQAIAAIALPNDASIKLHESMGFFRAGVYRSVGWKQGAWRDVGLWQRELAMPEGVPAEPRPFSEVGLVRND